MIDLSVCVISYNQSKYIEQCLKSIVQQKTKYNVEIVLSDDCSNDDTVLKAREILINSNLPYTINIMPSNGGFQENLKAALNICKGRFIALCEADDYWCTDSRIDKQIKILDSNKGLALSFSAAKSVNEKGEYLGNMRPNIGNRIYTASELISKGSSLCPTFTIVFRRSFYEKITPKIYEQPVFDYPLQVLLAVQGEGYYFDEYFGCYRRNAIGSWSAGGGTSDKLVERYKASRCMHLFFINQIDKKYKWSLNFLFYKGVLVFFSS